MRKLAMVVALACVALPALVGAQPYPSKPIRMVLPYPPGGTTDILGRLMSSKMSPLLGQPVVVENRAGASGNIAFEHVAKSAPDGYTVLFATATFNMMPAFNDKLPFNILTDFAPISTIVSSQNLLVIRPTLPVNNIKELIAYAKANPGKMTYGSAGISTTLICLELLKNIMGLDIVQVPYKGDAPAVQDLLGGQTDMYCTTITGLVAHHRSGKLRGLAVTSKKRAASLQDVPTMEEAGVPGYDLEGWYGFLAPAGVPRPIIDRLNETIVKVVAMPDVQQRMLESGSDPQTSTPEEFAKRLRDDLGKFTRLVKSAKIKAE